MKVQRASNWKICADPANAGLVVGWQNDIPLEATKAPVPAAFAVAMGFPCPGGYVSGVLAARFRQRSGCVVVSTVDLLAHRGRLAVADQLTANLLRYATS